MTEIPEGATHLLVVAVDYNGVESTDGALVAIDDLGMYHFELEDITMGFDDAMEFSYFISDASDNNVNIVDAWIEMDDWSALYVEIGPGYMYLQTWGEAQVGDLITVEVIVYVRTSDQESTMLKKQFTVEIE